MDWLPNAHLPKPPIEPVGAVYFFPASERNGIARPGGQGIQTDIEEERADTDTHPYLGALR